jgi:hypothetical protein
VGAGRGCRQRLEGLGVFTLGGGGVVWVMGCGSGVSCFRNIPWLGECERVYRIPLRYVCCMRGGGCTVLGGLFMPAWY